MTWWFKKASVKRICCGLIMLCSVLSCSKESGETRKSEIITGNLVTEYIIPQGQHVSTASSLRLVKTKELKFTARFDSSSVYTARNPENAGDINKLYGFSDCSSHHQKNSARVGWIWNGAAIELYAYCYADGRRISKLLGTAAINEEVLLTISVKSGQYEFTMRNEVFTIERGCSGDNANGYLLYPYFGGDETAPQDVHIFIREL